MYAISDLSCVACGLGHIIYSILGSQSWRRSMGDYYYFSPLLDFLLLNYNGLSIYVPPPMRRHMSPLSVDAGTRLAHQIKYIIP